MKATSIWFSIASVCSALIGCGGEALDGTASATGGGSGSFTVMADLPTATSSGSYERSVDFTSAPTCVDTQLGACQIDPCYVPSSSQSPSKPPANAGRVSIVGADMTSISLEPGSDGAYAAELVTGQLPWTRGGEPVTMRWAHGPGDAALAGGEVSLASPPYVELSAASTFAVDTSTVSRARDLTVSWSSQSAPTAEDQVLVVLVSPNSGGGSALSTRVLCQFSASAGVGVVPASTLGLLRAGPGTYDIHSKEYASRNLQGSTGELWHVGFNVMAHARASYGLATGSVTFQ
jgi:hypothetical protein